MLDVADVKVAFLRYLARPSLKTLDRARDRGQRRPQLMGGIGDELALDAPTPLTIGDVAHDHQRRLRTRPPGSR